MPASSCAQPTNRAIAIKRFGTNQNIASHKSVDDCIAAFRARVPFARPTSFKILEIVSGARSVRVCVRGPTFAVRKNTSLRVRSVSNVSIGDGPVSAKRESHGFDRDGQRQSGRQSGQCQAALARANADIGATRRIRREQHA